MGILVREDQLTERIIACAIRVHQTLGNGFVEKIYKRAMVLELGNQNIPFEIEKHFYVYYNGRKIGRHTIDLLVDSRVVVELKTVEVLGKKQYAQLRSYLKAAELGVGLLINFSGRLSRKLCKWPLCN